MNVKRTLAPAIKEDELYRYLDGDEIRPLFLHGEVLETLRSFPNESIDCCMTSPPYWGQRQYATDGIGLEADYKDYIAHLAMVCLELKRVLKVTGSFWLNLGDSYSNKKLIGIPLLVDLELTDNQE